MTVASSPYTVPAALQKADDIIGPARTWMPINPTQGVFLNAYDLVKDQIQCIPEIECIASWDATEINTFLKERGFSIEVGPFAPNKFGTAAALELLLKWRQPGRKSSVTYDDKQYPAVVLEDVNFYVTEDHQYLVVGIPTQTEDIVYLTVEENVITDEFSLYQRVSDIKLQITPQRPHDVIFPMVELDSKSELGWLVGLNTISEDGDKVVVDSALRQTMLKMNEVGVKVKEAAAITFEVLGYSPPIIIDAPFLMWIERPGLAMPLFAGYITPENWKDPGEL